MTDDPQNPIDEQTALDVVASGYSDSKLEPVDREDVAVDAKPTLFVTEETYEQYENGTVTRDDLGAHADDTITTEQRYHTILSNLFTPRSRAIILDTWLRIGTEPVTISEVAEQSDQLSRQTVNSHKDALLNEFQIITEAGKKGNATVYRLNHRNPIVQCLEMLSQIGRFGQTKLLLEREFLVPGPTGGRSDELESPSTHD